MSRNPSEMTAAEILTALLPAGVTLPESVRGPVETSAQAFILRKGRIPGQNGAMRTLSRIAHRLYTSNRKEAYQALLAAVPAIKAEDPQHSALERDVSGTSLPGEARESAPMDITAVSRALRARRREATPVDESVLEPVCGPLQDDLGKMLAALPVERWRTDAMVATARAFRALAPAPSFDEETYVQRFIWGVLAREFCRALTSQNLSEELQALSNQLPRHIDAVDPAEIDLAGGRSLLFVGAHSGVGSVVGVGLEAVRAEWPLPSLTISKNASKSAGRQGIRLGTEDLKPTDFLKVLKTIRKEPHQIVIYPDGPNGRDRGDFELLGKTVSIGLGAAALAWYGRAQTFFVGTRWHGTDRLETYVVPGPIADPDDDRNAFDEAFHRFYLDRLTDIALGPPENIGVTRSGIWPALISSPRGGRSSRKAARMER